MKKIKFILEIVILVFIDQITKYIVHYNRYDLPKTVIKNILEITYCENTGIAFGIFSGKIVIISIITIILLLSIVFLIKANFNKINKLALLGIVFVISGGIGNFIDRIFRGYVIDFIDFGQLVNFPIFNFADICVVLGVIIVGISYFIMNRGESFENNNCKR